jgi:hypothetical protein
VIAIDTNASKRSLNMFCKIIFLNDMGKNENGDSFVNRCIRLGGSVVVTSATGNKFHIAQLPSTNRNNNYNKQAPLIKSKYVT